MFVPCVLLLLFVFCLCFVFLLLLFVGFSPCCLLFVFFVGFVGGEGYRGLGKSLWGYFVTCCCLWLLFFLGGGGCWWVLSGFLAAWRCWLGVLRIGDQKGRVSVS